MPPSDFNEPQNPYLAPRPVAHDDMRLDAEFDDGPLQPFKTIWLHPRRTIRQLVAHNPELYVVPLVCLAGIVNVLDRASQRNLGDRWSLATILGIAFLLGPLGGLFALWIFSHLIRITGNWIGGTAPREHLNTAIAWAKVPAVVTLPLWLLLLALFGFEMFTSETPRMDAEPMIFALLIAVGIVETILSIWAFVLLCNTVAEVQGYRSAWRGLGNLLLAGLLLVVPLIVLGLALVVLLRP